MIYFVTIIASLLATIVAARGDEKAPPAATDDGNIMSRVLALEKIVEEQRVQLEDVHDVVSSLHSRRTQTEKCFEAKGSRLIIKCSVVMRRWLVVNKEFTAKGDSLFEGGNVFIENGTGDINERNGKGNLIVGGKSADAVANPGSHNVIIGEDNKYSSYGGLVVGIYNEISADFASVTGGSYNIARGYASSISGGNSNEVRNYYSSVSGGESNIASASSSSIGGGKGNRTPYFGSTVTGTLFKETQSAYENLP